MKSWRQVDQEILGFSVGTKTSSSTMIANSNAVAAARKSGATAHASLSEGIGLVVSTSFYVSAARARPEF